ncbi:MAG: dynamin family protein, partial [Magnetococcales bacterium]|nr:dynamin family protein [Magnetococcales bacterium]
MSIYQELLEVAGQFGIQTRGLQGDLMCAFIGEWNAGKSALINNLTGAELPCRPIQTTRAAVHLRHSETAEPYTKTIDHQETVQHYHGAAAINALQCATTATMRRIEFYSPTLDIPSQTILVDTPGFNHTDAIATIGDTEQIHADLVVWVLMGDGPLLNQQQLDWVRRASHHCGTMDHLFFVVTHIDWFSHPETDRKAILDYWLARTGQEKADQLFFVDNKSGEGIAEFKAKLYHAMAVQQPILLEQRRQRYSRELLAQLQVCITREQTLIEQWYRQC